MEIEQKRQRFLNILSALYQVERKEEIRVSEGALLENGLGGRDFWEVICPSLKKEAVLKQYSDPEFSTEFILYYADHPLYKDLSDRQKLLQGLDVNPGHYYAGGRLFLSPQKQHEKEIADEIKQLDVEMAAAKSEIRSRYSHRFVVDVEKLLLSTPSGNRADTKHVVVSDTPAGTTWAKMRLQFTGRYSLHVSVSGTQWVRDNMTPKDFGLEKKGGRPMAQWVMLQALSKNDSKFPLANFSGKEKETKRRQLTDLAQIFQGVFPNVTGGRAIRPTADKSGYECVSTLIPEQSNEEERALTFIPEQNTEDD